MEGDQKAQQRIAELGETVERLKQAEENYRHLLQYAPTGIYELDYKIPKLLSVNDAMCKLTGYSREELLAINPFKILEPDSAERFKERIKKGLDGEKLDENVEFRVITKDGRHIWVQLFVKPIYRKGKIDTALVVGYDVTEHKKADLAVLESEKTYRNLLEASPDAIVVHAAGKVYYANPAGLRLYRAESFEQLAIRDFFSLVPKEDRSLAEQRTEKVASGQVVKRRQARILTLTGEVVPVEVSSRHINFQGKDLAQTVIRDITERKKAEEALRDSEHRYRNLFANMMEGFAFCQMLFDSKGVPQDFVYIEINDAFEKLTGLKRQDVVGRKITEAIPSVKEANPEIFDVYGRVAKSGIPERLEIFFKPLSAWLDIAVSSPERGYFVAVFENISDRKELQSKLERYASELETIVEERTRQLKDKERLAAIGETAGMVGHDIRNPLQAMVSDLYLLRSELTAMPEWETKEGVRESLDSIESNIEYVNKIVSDLQDYTRPLKPNKILIKVSDKVSHALKNVRIPNKVRLPSTSKTA